MIRKEWLTGLVDSLMSYDESATTDDEQKLMSILASVLSEELVFEESDIE